MLSLALVVLKDKISVLGPGLELQVLDSVILSQQASRTMVWAVVYVTGKYRLKPASNNRRLSATYQLSNFQPTRLATTDALPEVSQHPATSEPRSVFAGYVCTCGACVLSEWTAHASKSSTHVHCPTLCWKLWSSLNATVLFVCDVTHVITGLRSRIEHWRSVIAQIKFAYRIYYYILNMFSGFSYL